MVRLITGFERSVLSGVLGLSVIANVALAWRVQHPVTPVSADLAVGASVAPLLLETADGSVRRVSYGDAVEGTVLYVTAPRCVWCGRNQQNMAELWRQRSSNYRMIGLVPSTESLKECVRTSCVPFELGVLSGQSRKDYVFTGLPQTVVVDRSGVIRANWIGAYDANLLNLIRPYFGISLPGVD